MTNLREMFTAETSILIEYKPSEKQWWITGFDPYEQNVNAKDLTVVYTVEFDDKDMFEGFKKNNSERDEVSINDDTMSVTITF